MAEASIVEAVRTAGGPRNVLMIKEGTVLFEREGSIAKITLNRPKAGNAIDIDCAHGLLDAAVKCDEDKSIRCVVITGAGRLFCAGGDVAKFAAAGDAVPTLLRELATTLHAALGVFARMRKPLLTVVNGPAAGAGLSLAICGDIVLAGRSANFVAAYGTVGLTPDGGMSWWLPRLVGLRRAQEIILTNRRISAEEAESFGMVTWVVADEFLAAEAADLAKTLSNSATAAIGGARQLLIDGLDRSLPAQLDAEIEAIVAAGSRAECREGFAAFADKRQPSFSSVEV